MLENTEGRQEERHCGVCVFFGSAKYGVYYCNLGYTLDDMFNYKGQLLENKSCEHIVIKGNSLRKD